MNNKNPVNSGRHGLR